MARWLRAWVVCVCVLGCWLGAAAQSLAADVLILGAPRDAGWNLDVRDVLNGTGRLESVDVWDLNDNGLPELEDLNSYDCVLVYTDDGFAQAAQLGDLLAAYVDQGYGVVEGSRNYSLGLNMAGRWVSGGYATLFSRAEAGGGSLDTSANHPIFENVGALEGGVHRSGARLTRSGAQRLGTWGDGVPVAVVREDKAGRIASLSVFPPSGRVSADFWPLESDNARLIVNALLWVSPQEPPSISIEQAPATLPEGQSAQLVAAAQDPNGEPLTISWDLDNDGDYDDAQGATATLPPQDGPALHTVRVQVSDGNTVANDSVQIQILNQLPTISSVIAVPNTARESTSVTLRVTAADIDDDPLTYRWQLGDGATAQGRTVTHRFTDVSQPRAVVEVDDGDGGVSVGFVDITITDLPPSIDGAVSGLRTLTEGQVGTWGISFDKALLDDVNVIFDWDDASVADQLFFEQDATSGLLQASHVFANDGAFELQVTLTDDDDSADQASLDITVTNVAPTIDTIELPFRLEEGNQGRFVAQISDPGFDPMALTWDFGDGDTDTQNFAPTVGQRTTTAAHTYCPGQYTVRLTAADDDTSTTATRSLTVANLDPEVRSLVLDSSSAAGAPTALVARAADPCADALTFTWNFGDGSEPIEITVPTVLGVAEARVNHVFCSGQNTVEVTVTDNLGGTDTAALNLQTQARPPTLIAFEGPEEVREGLATGWSFEASDACADVLRFTWSFSDDGPTIVEDVATTNGRATSAVSPYLCGPGQRAVTVTVDDFQAEPLTASQNFTIDQTPMTLLDHQVGSPINEGEPLVASAHVSNVCAGEVTFDWDFGPGTQPVEVRAPGEVDFEAEAESQVVRVSGNRQVSLAVSSEDGQSFEDTVDVVVRNVAPTITAIQAPQTVTERQNWTATATATDPGAEALTFTWAPGGGVNPVVQTDGALNGERTSTFSTSFCGPGQRSVLLTVADPDGGQTVRAQTVDVQNVPPSVASLQAPNQAVQGQEVGFEAIVTEPCAASLEVVWDFGDGTQSEPVEVALQAGQATVTAAHTYLSRGDQLVRLLVTDAREQITAEHPIEILNAAPTDAALLEPQQTTVSEGQTVSFVASAQDAGQEPLRFEWSFDDGQPGVEESVEVPAGQPRRSAVTRTFVDDGVHQVTAQIGDGQDSVQLEVTLTVNNVAPRLTTDPPRFAQPEEGYTVQLTATDPGINDTLTFELLQSPEGMTLSDDGQLSFVPPQGLEAFEVSVRVDDGDGGQDTLSWEVLVGFTDEDEDGAPDQCERDNGFDPTDPEDGAQDADLDGLTNAQECQRGTDPRGFNGPGAPSIESPLAGARVDVAALPDLVINNAVDPDEDALVYTFEVYHEDEPLVPVIQADVDGGVSTTSLPLASEQVQWQVGEFYWWRARASDGLALGPWSDLGVFLVIENLEDPPENFSPPTPTLIAPIGLASEAEPDFVVAPVTDPDGDEVSYLFEVYEDEGLEALFEAAQSPEPRWRAEGVLVDGQRYWWRAAAQDSRGDRSAFGPAQSFVVNAANRLPPAPSIVAPQQGQEITSLPLEVVWGQVEDPNADPVVYVVEVALADSPQAVVLRQEVDPAGQEGNLSVTVPGLEEDTAYILTVAAADPFGAGPRAEVSFQVNVEDGAPNAPVLLNPVGGELASLNGEQMRMAFAASTDPEGQGLTYTLEVFSDSTASERLLEVAGITARSSAPVIEVMVDALPAGDGYAWVVTAEDEAGNLSVPSDFETFAVSPPTTPPDDVAVQAPMAVSPVLGQEVEPEAVVLVATAAELEQEATHVFEVFADRDLSESVWRSQEIEAEGEEVTAEVDADAIDGHAELFWVVTATDGQMTLTSVPASFRLSGVLPAVQRGNISADGGCSTAPGRASDGLWLCLLGALVWVHRRRRRLA